MARNRVSIINTNGYTNDFGVVLPENTVTAVLTQPTWMTNDALNTILTAFGFRRKGENEVLPCGSATGERYRRIIFETNRGSFSVPLVNANANVEALQTIVNDLDASVLCVKKEGERRLNVYNLLRTSTDDITPGTRAISSGPGSRFSGKYEYRDDANIIRLLSFGIDTETPGQPPGILNGNWTTCAGTSVKVRCASTSYIRPRHYNLTTVFKESELVNAPIGGDQRHKIPHATSTVGNSVRLCGVALANLAAAACLDYEGESDRRYNETLGLTL